MIKYNMRYRGPIEYDKLVLTALSFHNETNALVNERKYLGEKSKTIKNLHDRLDAWIDLFQTKDRPASQYYESYLKDGWKNEKNNGFS